MQKIRGDGERPMILGMTQTNLQRKKKLRPKPSLARLKR